MLNSDDRCSNHVIHETHAKSFIVEMLQTDSTVAMSITCVLNKF